MDSKKSVKAVLAALAVTSLFTSVNTIYAADQSQDKAKDKNAENAVNGQANQDSLYNMVALLDGTKTKSTATTTAPVATTAANVKADAPKEDTQTDAQKSVMNNQGFYVQQDTTNGGTAGVYNSLTKDGLWVGGTSDETGFHVDNQGNAKTTGTVQAQDFTMTVKDMFSSTTYDNSFDAAGLVPGQSQSKFSTAIGHQAFGDPSIGKNANQSVAIGDAAQIKDGGEKSTAIGYGSAIGDFFGSAKQSVAVGANSSVSKDYGVAIGESATVNTQNGIAIGQKATIGKGAVNSVAIGGLYEYSEEGGLGGGGNELVAANAKNSTVIGAATLSQSEGGTALGKGARVGQNSDGSVALGVDASVEMGTKNAVALGANSVADQENTVSVGNDTLQRKIVNVADGKVEKDSHDAVTGGQLYDVSQKVTDLDSLAVKYDSDAKDTVTFANGTTLKNVNDVEINVKGGSRGLVSSGITPGTVYAKADGWAEGTAADTASLAIGGGLKDSQTTSATVRGKNSIAIGSGARVDATAQELDAPLNGFDYAEGVAIGVGANVSGIQGTAVGYGATVKENKGTAFGNQSKANGNKATAIGFSAVADADNSTVLGQGASVGTGADNSVALGAGSTVFNSDLKDTDKNGVVSVGSGNAERRIIHVADGVDANDAVNKGQLDTLADKSVQYDTKEDGTTDFRNVTFKGEGWYGTNLNNVGDIQMRGAMPGNPLSFKAAGIVPGVTLSQAKEGIVSLRGSALAMNAIAIGNNAMASELSGIAIGVRAISQSEYGVAIGEGTWIDPVDQTAKVKGDKGSVALGAGSTVSKEDTKNGTIGVVSVGNGDKDSRYGATRKIINVTDGTIAEGSHDAVTGGQLFTTNENLAAETKARTDADKVFTDKFAAYEKAGVIAGETFGENSFALGKGSYVGSNALALGQGAQSVNNSAAVGQSAAANGDNSLALGNTAVVTGVGVNSVALGNNSYADEANVVSVGGRGVNRKIVNVANGAVSETSTDAVTGNQLFAEQEARKAADQKLTDAGIIAGSASNDKNPGNYKIALGIGSVTEAEKGTALGAGAKVLQGASESVALGYGSVAGWGDVSKDGKLTDPRGVVSVGKSGKDGFTRRIVNVKDGVNDTDAATVGQLNKISDGLTNAGIIPGSAETKEGSTWDNMAIGKNSKVTNDTEGYGSVYSSTAIGVNAQINATGNAGISKSIAFGNSATVSALNKNASGIAIGDGAKILADKNTAELNIALGYNAAIENSDTSIAIGNDSSVKSEDKQSSLSTAIGNDADIWDAKGSTALGYSSKIYDADYSTALGGGTVKSTTPNTDDNPNPVTGSIAFGRKAIVTDASNSVALGSYSVVDKEDLKDTDTNGVISVGSSRDHETAIGTDPAFTRRIINVSDGINANDAVNKGQLDAVTKGGISGGTLEEGTEGSVAVGKGSYVYNDDLLDSDKNGVVSFGQNDGFSDSGDEVTRRLIHVGTGVTDSDAATVGQTIHYDFNKDNTINKDSVTFGGTYGTVLNNVGDIKFYTSRYPDNAMSFKEAGITPGLKYGKNVTADNVVLGPEARIVGYDEVDKDSKASVDESVVIGNNAKVSAATQSTAIGGWAEVYSEHGTALGNGARVGNDTGASVSLGANSNVNKENLLADGSESLHGVVSVGKSGDYGFTRRIINVADGVADTDAATVGQVKAADKVFTDAFAAYEAAGITAGTVNDGDYNVALGNGATVTGGNANTAIGEGTTVDGAYNVALGYGANTQNGAENSIAIGYYGQANANNSIAIGQAAKANKDKATAIGDSTNADYQGVALGANANASAGNGVAIGADSIASGVNSTALGYGSKATASQATALGQNAQALAEQSVALGEDSIATEKGTVSVGNGSWLSRRIVNVADGIGDHDAATVGQMNVADQKVKDSVTSTFDQKFTDLQNSLKASGNDSAANAAALSDLKTSGVVGGVIDGSGSVAISGKNSSGANKAQINGKDIYGAVAIGPNTRIDWTGKEGWGMIAIGDGATVNQSFMGALVGAKSTLDNSQYAVGFGDNLTIRDSYAGTSLGNTANIINSHAGTALGATTKVLGADRAVALGSGSVAVENDTISVGRSAEDVKKYNDYVDQYNKEMEQKHPGDDNYKLSPLADGNDIYRRITNVAAGTGDHDATIVGQFKGANNSNFLQAVGKFDWKYAADNADKFNKFAADVASGKFDKLLNTSTTFDVSRISALSLATDVPTSILKEQADTTATDQRNPETGSGSTSGWTSDKDGLTTTGKVTTGDLVVNGNATLNKDLTVNGNTTLKDTTVKGSLTVGEGKDAINVGDSIKANQAAIEQNSNDIKSLGTSVTKLGDEVDSVGAISAALAGLHPLDYGGKDSKFQISAALGSYDGTRAAALGGFYNANRDTLISFGVSTNLNGDARKTAANIGATFRVGQGNSKEIPDDVASLRDEVVSLKAENATYKDRMDEMEKQLQELLKASKKN